jgi:hypothetical protein
METGKWTAEQIEVHDIPKHLFGYKGDQREETANVIIRRKHIGSSSNDLGFIKGEDGNYTAIISEFDSKKYGEVWNGQLKGNYAFHKVRTEQEAHGRSVEREQMTNGHQRVIVTGYR